MKLSIRHIAAAAALVVAVAPAAWAKPGNGQQHSGKAKGKGTVMYVFKGTWSGSDTVHVLSGNAHVRKANLVTDVTFDLTAAKFVVDDTNADGNRNVDDLKVGDKVLVQARLPRKNPDVSSAIKARMLVDQTHAPAPATPEQD
jgi:mevalonate kinase